MALNGKILIWTIFFLQVNDKVLEVNEISCINVDHYEAVGILKVSVCFQGAFLKTPVITCAPIFEGA